MPYYNEICHWKDCENKNNNKKAKTKLTISKAPSNNVKLQSDKTLTTQFYVFLTKTAYEIFLNETT